MSADDLDEALSLIRQNLNRFHFVGPPSAELIRLAEKALGHRLPPQYRRFVAEFGAGGVGSQEIYGITTADFSTASVPNGIWYTLTERRRYGLPESMIAFHNDGYDGVYVLDSSKAGADGEPPVEVWEPWHTGPVKSLELIAPDFGTWLLDAVRFSLRDNDDEDSAESKIE